MTPLIVVAALSVLSIYFFYENQYGIAVLLLIFAFERALGRKLRALGKILNYWAIDQSTNCFLKVTINFTEVLKHPCISRLFLALQEKKILQPQLKEEDWTSQLIQNYKNKYKTEDTWENVNFHIKNNTLWKNEKEDFNDHIFHEIFIPHRENEKERMLQPSINSGITIRLLMVNGLLKLELGEYSKEISPEVFDKGHLNLGIYKRYDQIAVFPLMYFSYEHKIGVKYLNLSAYATPSYYQDLAKDKYGKKRWADWKILNEEVADYRYLCATSSESLGFFGLGKWEKTIRKFEKKKSDWLAQQEFQKVGTFGNLYSNKYLCVEFVDYEASREKREQYLYPDYEEEEYYP